MKKILVIDDDGLVLKSVVKLLNSRGYEAVGYKNGSEAIKVFSAGQFDLVVCDIRMPEQSGLSVMKEIRDIEKKTNRPQTPFIVITGYASEDAPLGAMELGAVGYILKPFDYDHFFETVQKALNPPQLSSVKDDSSNQYQAIKRLISDYYGANAKEVSSNPNLRELLAKLEDVIDVLEKQDIKRN